LAANKELNGHETANLNAKIEKEKKNKTGILQRAESVPPEGLNQEQARKLENARNQRKVSRMIVPRIPTQNLTFSRTSQAPPQRPTR
jgi:hypothetical protein